MLFLLWPRREGVWNRSIGRATAHAIARLRSGLLRTWLGLARAGGWDWDAPAQSERIACLGARHGCLHRTSPHVKTPVPTHPPPLAPAGCHV